MVDEYMARNPKPTEEELASAGASSDPVSRFFALAVRLHRLADYRATRVRTDEDRVLGKEEIILRKLFHGLTELLRTYYGITDDVDEFEYFKVGTTSVIIRDPDAGDAVYKCVLPRYVQTDEIRTETSRYGETIRNVRHVGLEDRVPAVVEGNARYTKQQFFPGKTLEEYLTDHRNDLHDSDEKDELRDVVQKVGQGLCDMLASLAGNAEQPHHLDISPSNIILKNRTGREFDADDVCLIDFGRNFLLEDTKVGAYSAYQNASIYIAPEVRRSEGVGTTTSDAFSVGMVLLDVLTCPGKQRTQSLPLWLLGRLFRVFRRGARTDALTGLMPENVDKALDDLYRDSPRLAAFIEDAIERDPDTRLALIGRPGLAQQFLTMKATIEHTCTVDALIPGPDEHEESISPTRVFRIVLSGLALDGVVGLFQSMRETNRRRIDKLPNDVVKTEGAWSLPLLATFVAVEWLLVLLAGVVFQGADFFAWFPGRGWVASVARHLPHQQHHGFAFPIHGRSVPHLWRANLAGRLTAVTFAFIAARYYLNIFSSLPFNAIPSHFGAVKKAVLWATGTVSPLICTGGILYPRYWAILGGIGSIFIVWNNVNMWLLARHALREIGPEPNSLGARSRLPLDQFERAFREWWLLFGLYGAALLVLGVLSLAGWVQDLLFDAILVAIVNYVKVYRNNCHDQAPMVRGSVARAIDVLRRVDRRPIGQGNPAPDAPVALSS
jgi:tRNA A-37 threonylcarbamoyl transferase component Bud32